METFPIVLAITVITLLLLFLTIPARNPELRVSIEGEGKCGPITLRTTALYFEHTGDEDKPIDPLIIATSRPGTEEIKCAVPRTHLVGSDWNLLVVKEEEFSHTATLLNRNVPTHESDPHADFQYVLVSKSARVQIGPFSDGGGDQAVRGFGPVLSKTPARLTREANDSDPKARWATTAVVEHPLTSTPVHHWRNIGLSLRTGSTSAMACCRQ